MTKNTTKNNWLQTAMEHLYDTDLQMEELVETREAIFGKIKQEIDLSDQQISALQGIQKKLREKIVEYLKANPTTKVADYVYKDVNGKQIGVISIDTKPTLVYKEETIIEHLEKNKNIDDYDLMKGCIKEIKKLDKNSFKRYFKHKKAIDPSYTVPGFSFIEEQTFKISTVK